MLGLVPVSGLGSPVFAIDERLLVVGGVLAWRVEPHLSMGVHGDAGVCTCVCLCVCVCVCVCI